MRRSRPRRLSPTRSTATGVRPTGGIFSIDGPKILTERGQTVQGDYRRHYFSYAVPEPAKDAGQVVQMALVNEFTVNVRAGDSPAAPVEIWKRCSPTS